MDGNTSNFSAHLVKELLADVYNYHFFNRDYERFAVPVSKRIFEIIKSAAILASRKLLGLTPLQKKFDKDIKNFEPIAEMYSSYEEIYSHLGDQQSKQLLIKILAYKILGRTRVKMPLNTPQYWKRRRYINKLVIDTLPYESGIKNKKIKLFDLEPLGYKMKILSVPFAALTLFELRHYEYAGLQIICKARPGDIAIDCGSCWGDSSLYLANEVAENGMVYSFEFIPNNLEIFRKNLEINPHLADRVKVIQQPVWEKSGKPLYVVDRGPASTLTEKAVPDSLKIETTSIDDFVRDNKIRKVDFIKMDIEGAEMPALKGCVKILRQFRPKLAISAYHKPDDIAQIGKFIISQKLGYRLFLGHYTIHREETVLFAQSQ